MNRRTLLVSVIAATLAQTVLAQQIQPPSADTPVRVDIGDGVFFLKGRSNCSFVVGEDGVILFDTLTSGNADVIRENIAAVTPLPIKYVVNTHSHADHIGSNLAFGEAGIPIVAQEIVLRRLSMQTMNARGQTIEPLPEKARPTITFADDKTLKIKGMKVELSYAPNGHMDDDLYARLPKQNIIIVGDLLRTDAYPSLDQPAGGTLAGNFRAMEAIHRFVNGSTKILPGHGSPMNGVEFVKYLEMMYRTVDQVDALIRDGKSADEVVAAGLLANDTTVAPGGPDNRDAFIKLVYEAVKNRSVTPR